MNYKQQLDIAIGLLTDTEKEQLKGYAVVESNHGLTVDIDFRFKETHPIQIKSFTFQLEVDCASQTDTVHDFVTILEIKQPKE